MNTAGIVRAVSLVVLSLCALSARADCGTEQYFHPTDANWSRPLATPHPDFQMAQRLAARGGAIEARNLAALYEAGYLVTRCREKAAYWYGKAADLGDDVAKQWMERHTALERLSKGPQCFGDGCFSVTENGIRKTTLRPGPGGAYMAMVTINGKSVPGIVDTGATYIALSAKTAQELGVAYSNGRQVQMKTANGVTTNRAVMLNAVTVGGITLTQVEATIGEADHPVLIGMSFLRRLTINTSGGAMTLSKP